ncbi:MAG: DUF4340 domain-containing protein [Bacteroidetes bacterium]|jgi:hypothetical protein|nr:DUF4340 domain-containing protein [Bacteroidota bacterium]
MKRSTTILIALFVVLAALAVWVMQRPGERSLSTASGDRLVEVDSAAVDALEVRGSEGTVRLERRGMEWFVTRPIEARANASTIAGAIGQAGSLRVKGIASAKREKHGLFQVDSATGTTVRMFAAGALQAAFVIGKPSDGFADTYVRKEASDDVALVAGSFGWTFNRTLRDWRDRTILAMPREEVREVLFQYGDTTFAMTFQDSVWYVDGRPANASAVEGVIGTLSNLTCDDFIDAPSGTKVAASITVAGQQLRLSREPKGTRWWVQSSAGPQWYVLESWRADQILKRKRDLL